jgi:UPF0489 domain
MRYRDLSKILAELKPDLPYREAIAPGVWLMDDHRWAFWVWARTGLKGATLVHADYHFDAINDLTPEELEELRHLPIAEIESKYLLPANQDAMNEQKTPIQMDSFIAPAILLGLINQVFFFCYQTDTDVGVSEDVLEAGRCRQTMLKASKDLRNIRASPLLFDLCLDLFNLDPKRRMYEETNLWTDGEIIEFLGHAEGLFQRADLVTISCSFGYSGSEEQTRALTRLVLPAIVSARQKQA